MEPYINKKYFYKKVLTHFSFLKKEKLGFLLIASTAFGQYNPNNPLINAPGDCITAYQLCDVVPSYNFQFIGAGSVDDANGMLHIPGMASSHPTQFEYYSAFIKFRTKYAGQLGWYLCPESVENLDFMLLKNPTCNTVFGGSFYVIHNISFQSDCNNGCTGVYRNPVTGAWANDWEFNYVNIEANTDYMLFVRINWYNYFIGTKRFTLKFTGPVVDAHPDLFDCSVMSEDSIVNYDSYTSVSPNPFTNELTIKSPIVFEKVKLYDVSGKLINEQNYKPTLTVNNLSQGVYFLHLLDHTGKQVVRKVVRE